MVKVTASNRGDIGNAIVIKIANGQLPAIARPGAIRNGFGKCRVPIIQ